MNLKKLTAALSALVCCGGMMPYIPFAAHETYAAELVHYLFLFRTENQRGTVHTERLTQGHSCRARNSASVQT